MANKLGLLISGFIILLMGLVFMSTVADSIYETRTLGQAGNETVTITGTAPKTGQLSEDDVVSIVAIANGTTGAAEANYLETFNITTAGAISSNETEGTYYIKYSFEPDGYVKDGTSRTLIFLINIFFALGVLAFAVGIFNELRQGMF